MNGSVDLPSLQTVAVRFVSSLSVALGWLSAGSGGDEAELCFEDWHLLGVLGSERST